MWNPTSLSQAFPVFNTVNDVCLLKPPPSLGFANLYYPVSSKNILAMSPPTSSFSCPITPGIPRDFTLGLLYTTSLNPLTIQCFGALLRSHLDCRPKVLFQAVLHVCLPDRQFSSITLETPQRHKPCFIHPCTSIPHLHPPASGTAS